MNKAVFLDRDGTINDHVKGYVTNWNLFRFLPNSLEALRLLSDSDYKVIVVTNQSAVGRGLMSQSDLDDIHESMLEVIKTNGARVDDILVCPHTPLKECGCRKPRTGLLEEAANRYELDLSNSWFVGDNTKDVKTGSDGGCQTVLLRTGYGGSDGLYNIRPDHVADDLLGAVKIILGL